MNCRTLMIAMLAGLFLITSAAAAEDPLQKGAQGAVDTFIKGCQQELTTYCKDVTPGEGRILACLYAFQDKLSPSCEYALYDTAAQLERTINTLAYVAGECRDDLQANCTGVKPGEGRLLDCLDKNQAKVSARCKEAVKAAGYK
jgi:hypothetical protein